MALATSRDPDLRPGDAGQFLRAVTGVRHGLPPDGARPRPPAASPSRRSATSSTRQRVASPSRRAAASPPRRRPASRPRPGAAFRPRRPPSCRDRRLVIPPPRAATRRRCRRFPGRPPHPAARSRPDAGSGPAGPAVLRAPPPRLRTAVGHPAVPAGALPPRRPAHADRQRRRRRPLRAAELPGYAPPEPRLQRLLFSRRLGYLAAAVAVVLVVGLTTWWLTSGRYTNMPKVTGMTVAAATAELTRRRLHRRHRQRPAGQPGRQGPGDPLGPGGRGSG